MTTVNVRNVDPDRVWKALGLWIFKPSAHNKTIGTANFICADENQSPKPSDLVKLKINRATSYSDIKTSVVRILEENNVKYNEDFVFWDLRCGAWTILRLCLPKNGEFRVNSISVIQCGNHSDELSPWIPVIAMLSSERTNFFLLPCCAFEFSGVKFKRTDSSKSVYMGYLDYLENLTRTLGFNVSRDRLKIPSTKRICLVSDGRFSAPPSSQFIKELVNDRCRDITAQEVNSGDLVANFQPRQSIEKVRNCTQLDRNFVTSLIAKISKILLTDASLSLSWQQGSPIAIPNLAEKLDRDDLLKLKSECG
ncbi:unnamed protein product, partial [Nesidiocoris tenuis]